MSKEIHQALHRGLLLIFIKRILEFGKEKDQELHKGLLLIIFIKSVWDQ